MAARHTAPALVTTARGWIDISVRVRNGMPSWPGDPPVRIERVQDIARGDTATVSQISISSHTGTHMDAPLHFVAGGRGLDEMDLEATIGPARVIAIEDETAVRRAELEAHDIRPRERILLKTRNSRTAWSRAAFVEDFVYISAEAASWLASRNVRAVGIDYLSVGGYERDAVETHRALLEAGVWIMEGLDLSAVEPGDYELMCLPLLIDRSDGAPARALLRPSSP